MTQPRIVARLLTDDHGDPIFQETANFRHYKIEIEAVDLPPDAYMVQFELDASYYDPVRTITPDARGRYRLETTTYGDYPVLARVMRTKGEPMLLKIGLARALGKPVDASPTLAEANTYIAAH
jgi:hypothetical protein